MMCNICKIRETDGNCHVTLQEKNGTNTIEGYTCKVCYDILHGKGVFE